jgi:hypothetical protein
MSDPIRALVYGRLKPPIDFKRIYLAINFAASAAQP